MLYKSRYCQFSFFVVEVDGVRKGRMEISPRPGQTPPPLPKWLQIPFLVPIQGYHFRIVPESSCANPAIQPGNELFTTDNPIFGELKHTGTLGPIMVSTHFRTGDPTYITLTAGHVIPDYQDTMFVRKKLDNAFIPLKVSERSKRLTDRPINYRDERPSFRDDCALLQLDINDVNYFQIYMTNINLHYFGSTTADIPAADALNPLAYPRHKALRQLLRRSRLIVHKLGASTDLTTGYLVRTQKKVEGWYVPESRSSAASESSSEDEESDSDESDGDLDEEEWLGVVKWGETAFSAPGDSGSLVFAMEEGVVVPLGIHIGAPTSILEHSVFISLDTFCYKAEEEGWDLAFASRGISWLR
jgi:hypothetical protein